MGLLLNAPEICGGALKVSFFGCKDVDLPPNPLPTRVVSSIQKLIY